MTSELLCRFSLFQLISLYNPFIGGFFVFTGEHYTNINLVACSEEDGLSSVSLDSRELFQAYYGMEYFVLLSGMEVLGHTGDGSTKNYQRSAMTVSYSHLWAV